MTQQEALAWVAEIFEEPVEKITPETLKEEIAAWDSLGVLNLMSAFDSNFNIQLPDGGIGKLMTVKDVLDVLGQHGILK
jgi:acyl carrier protein